LLLAVLFLCACDPCRNLDCVASNYNGQFRIVQAASANDLVFGSNARYNKDSIRFFSVKAGDTTFYNSQALYFPGTGYDSILQVRFFPKTDTAYMQLGNGDTDTLQMQFRTYNTRCCGVITEITNVRFNNGNDLPGNGTQELKK